jgi:phosphohistidine phosphatase
MSQLYLLRHGIAEDRGSPGVPDEERRLTPEGEKRVGQVAKGLRRLKIEPDRIVTSPLPRARRTAEIVAEVLGLEDRLEDADVLRAGTSAGSIREWLRGREESCLMLVGHNPDLTDLLGLLLGISVLSLPFDLKKGGIAALESDDGNGHNYQLHWLATPKLIRLLTE